MSDAPGPIPLENDYTLAANGGERPQTSFSVVHCIQSLGANQLSYAGNSLDADAVAMYWRSQRPPASAHIIVTPDGLNRCVPDELVAYHALPTANWHGVGAEMPGHVEQTREEWLKPSAYSQLLNAAYVHARWAVKYGWAPKRATAADLIRARDTGESVGYAGHDTVTEAFPENGQADHSDPGPNFPWDVFGALVEQWYAFLSDTGSTAPNPAPSNPIPSENWTDVMINNLPTVSASFSYNAYAAIVQGLCIGHGYNPGPVDGIYGGKTAAAVAAFQNERKISADEIVGPVTWRNFLNS